MKLGDFTGISGISNQDIAMWETMGSITDRSKDKLGASDFAVVIFRQIMIEAVKRVLAGCRRRKSPGSPAIAILDRLRVWRQRPLTGAPSAWRKKRLRQATRSHSNCQRTPRSETLVCLRGTPKLGSSSGTLGSGT